MKDNSATYVATTTTSDVWSRVDDRTYGMSAGGTSTNTLFTLNGISTITENAVGSNYVITLGSANFAGMSITLTGGASYSMTLDGDYTQSVTAAGFGDLVDNAVTYYDEGKSEGYALTSATLIAHQDETKGDELFTASNITSKDNVKYADGAITATNAAGAKLTLTNMSSEKLTLGGFAEIDSLNATNHTVAGTPTNAKADGSNLIVTTADGDVTIDGAATQTVKLTGDNANYTATFDRITDVTDTTAKAVTLTTDFKNTYYGLHQSYGKGVTAVDATQANVETLNLTGAKQSDDLNLKGADKANNSVTGGSGNDTITGGSQNDLLKGNAGNDLFIQSAGDDTISDYNEGEDKISLASVLNDSVIVNDDVLLTTDDENTILILDGNGKAITVIDKDGNESKIELISGLPKNASVSGDDLVVEFADGRSTKYTGKANASVEITYEGSTYEVTATKITDITDESKEVTLTTDYINTYYGLHQSYGKGVTAVDATQANVETLNLTGAKQSDDLNLKGADKANNSVTGGSGNDTLRGGSGNDTLKGNAGADVFMQSGGDDVIVDYVAGEDKLELLSEATPETVGTDVKYTNAYGTVLVKDGAEKEIETEVGEIELAIPVDTSVTGNDLAVKMANGLMTIVAGAASGTATIEVDGKTYTATADRITDETNVNAKSVTMLSGFTGTYYGFHNSYGKGVTSLDASKVESDTLTIAGHKSDVKLYVKGSDTASNVITGGKAGDTLIGGTKNDTLKGNASKDLFVQTAGNDVIVDYTTDEDRISLTSALSSGSVKGNDVVLTTKDGNTILVTGANNQSITTVLDGTPSTTLFGSGEPSVTGVPVDTAVDGSDLVVTFASGDVETFAGAAADVVTIDSDDGEKYTAEATRITNITNSDAKSVTLTGGFEGTYYGFHNSYGKGVTSLDASKVERDTLTITGHKSEVELYIKGSDTASNVITGGKAGDTLIGGTKNDTLKGNASKDLFVQTTGDDVIVDYTADDDRISLASALKGYTTEGNNVVFTTDDGTITIKDGKDQAITTILDGTETTSVYGDTVGAGIPVDSSVNGSDLVITFADGDVETFAGAAESTVSLEPEGTEKQTFTVTKDRITDTTDASDKKVTLTSGFDGTYYGMHYTYSKNVTAVDASKANGESLTITGYKSTISLNLKGSDNVGSAVTGGKVADTIQGGAKDDTLKGGAGADTFVQTAGNDVIADYTTADVIVLQSALTATAGDTANVTLTTAEGTIVVENGVNKNIKTKVGEDGNERTTLFLSEVPTSVRAASGNLLASVAGSRVTLGASTDTVQFNVGENKYTATSDRITDKTDADAKSVTLTSAFTKGYYGLHYSYGEGVTAVDATAANTEALNLTGSKSEANLKLIGADKATNSLTGGSGNDTLIGGSQSDTLKGHAGADWFVQSGGDDVILDYTEEDTILLASAASVSTSGSDVIFKNDTGSITVLNGSDLDINTVIGGSANLATTNDELWGRNGVKDTFLFDGGNDTIHNYEAQDEINLGGYSLSELVNGAPSVSDNSLIFAFDKKNSFTVVDAVGKDISFTDGSTYSKRK